MMLVIHLLRLSAFELHAGCKLGKVVVIVAFSWCLLFVVVVGVKLAVVCSPCFPFVTITVTLFNLTHAQGTWT